MSHIIGRGRYAREVYPTRTVASGAFPRVGYDQPIEGMELPPTLIPALFPRDVAGNPLRVTIPNVTPGNTLEVDVRVSVLHNRQEYEDAIAGFTVFAIVTYDGTTVFPGTFQAIVDGAAIEAQESDNGALSLSSLSAVEIPVGATTAVVEVLYISTQTTQVSGVNKKDVGDPPTSATLKVSEITLGATAQLGPGVLEPLI